MPTAFAECFRMPDAVLTFYTALFNTKPKKKNSIDIAIVSIRMPKQRVLVTNSSRNRELKETVSKEI